MRENISDRNSNKGQRFIMVGISAVLLLHLQLPPPRYHLGPCMYAEWGGGINDLYHQSSLALPFILGTMYL